MMNKRDQHQILGISYIFRTEIPEQVQEGGDGDHEGTRKQNVESKIKASGVPLSEEAWENRKTFQRVPKQNSWDIRTEGVN